MTILEKVKLLPRRIGAAIEAFAAIAPAKKPVLTELADKGALVAAMMATEGYDVTEAERRMQFELLQERFLTGDVKDWEQYLELRGYVNGFRAAQQVEQQVVAQGIRAEKVLREQRDEE